MKTRNVVLKIETRKGFKGCISEVKYLPVGLLFDRRSALFEIISSSMVSAIRINFSPFTKDLRLKEKDGKGIEDLSRRLRAKLYITKFKEEWE
jgi:hypothetical protein